MTTIMKGEFFSDGLAEEIINLLAQIAGLKVTARTSAFAFKGKSEDIRRIAEALGVGHVLEGSVRTPGIAPTHYRGTDPRGGWYASLSQRYEREMAGVFGGSRRDRGGNCKILPRTHGTYTAGA
jgi:hypothetical protein